MPGLCRRVPCITPPHILRKLLESPDRNIRECALNTLLVSAAIRGERNVRTAFAGPVPGEPGAGT